MIGSLLDRFRNKAPTNVLALDFNLTGIVLLTGLPGAGKTLRMMQIMQESVRAGRPCFACNIDGLDLPGVLPWDDPKRWKELPPRAVLFVDEAQDFFRTRPGVVTAPDYITDMEKIRHDGVCLVLTTQQPTYIDKHVRGLITHHEHRIEVLAGYESNVYVFRRCCEALTDGDLKAAGFKLWPHPRDLHSAYKSAEVHTKRFIIPKRIVLLGVGTVLAAAFLAWAFLRDPPKHEGSAQAAPAAGLSASLAGSTNADPPPKTPAEYAAFHLPRFASMPWTAPVFDERPAISDPLLMCMSSLPGQDASGEHQEASCRCVTEQGTAYDMPDGECRAIARRGMPYNPYRERRDQQGGQMQAGQGLPVAPPVRVAAVASAPAGASTQFGRGATYGRDGINAY